MTLLKTAITHKAIKLVPVLMAMLLSSCLHFSDAQIDNGADFMNASQSAHELTQANGIWQLTAIERSTENGNSNNTESVTESITHSHGQSLFTLAIAYSKSNDSATASGKLGCNNWHGKAQLDSTTLQFSGIASTRKKCHYPSKKTAAIAHEFLSLLQQKNTYHIVNNTLYLSPEIKKNEEIWAFERQ